MMAWITVSSLMFTGARLSAADLVLVQGGKPSAVLVAAEEAHARQAAGEIQKYVEKMSGAKLPILREGEADSTGLPVKVFIGHTREAAADGVAIPSGFKEVVGDPNVFEEEGFVIKTLGDKIFIGGNSDGPYRGTIYAGYDFLERLGCRWYFPGEWGEVVPEKKTITFPETDVLRKPDFALRQQGLGGWFPSTEEEQKEYAEWGQKVKFNDAQAFYPGVGDGLLAYLIPPNEFYKKDPELFAMNEQGSREPPIWSNGKYYENVTMLSLSNPRTFEVAVQNLKDAYARKRPLLGNMSSTGNGFGISPPDGVPFDFDPRYKDANQDFNYPAYADHPQNSEEFFGFASKLAKTFPDKWVVTMAYSGREVPPQGVEIPHNIAVMYAPIASDVLHPGNDPASWRRTETMEILKQWLKLTPHVFMYDYNPGFLLGSFVPERDAANFAVNAKLYKQLGMKGFETEGRKTFMITWLSYYVRGKLMWDSNADVEAIKNDFYTTFFGPEAGPFVEQWWDACEKALGAATNEAHEDWLVDHIYTAAFVQRIHEYVEKAAQRAMTPKQKEHFQAFALIADHLEAIAARDEAEKNLDYAEAVKQAQRAEKDDAKLADISSFFIGPKEHPDFNNGFMQRYAQLAKMVNGDEGTMIGPVPLEAKLRRDPFNEGVLAQWYLPEFDDSDWGTENTFYTWDQQDKPEDAEGHFYNGYGWYRFTVQVPADAVNKPLKFHLGGVINEGWVWINGHYAGHRPWRMWCEGRKGIEMDVDATGKVKAGRNVITVRVWKTPCDGGGLLRRGFIYTPKP
jgi:hypothetical protein